MKLIDFVVTGSGFIFLLAYLCIGAYVTVPAYVWGLYYFCAFSSCLALCFFARNKFAPLVFFMPLLAWGTLVFLLQLFGAGQFSALIVSGFSVAVHILIAVAVGFVLRKISNRLDN